MSWSCPIERTSQSILISRESRCSRRIPCVGEPTKERVSSGVCRFSRPWLRNESGAEFLARLKPFLKKLASGYKFAVEIRNKYWLDARFVETLREHGVALALIDQSWMPRPWEMKENLDLITTDFTYVRWLGDRKGIEEQTKSWDKTVVDRTGELKEWVDVFMKFFFRNIKIFAFANNHYGGHAPDTVRQFQRMLAELGHEMWIGDAARMPRS
jgi:uncharacterized protein YecE (DUF72 family)